MVVRLGLRFLLGARCPAFVESVVTGRGRRSTLRTRFMVPALEHVLPVNNI